MQELVIAYLRYQVLRRGFTCLFVVGIVGACLYSPDAGLAAVAVVALIGLAAGIYFLMMLFSRDL